MHAHILHHTWTGQWRGPDHCTAVQIVSHLLSEVQRVYGTRVAIYREHAFQSVDVAAQRITYATKQGSQTVEFDILVGADGVHSPIRTAMIAQVRDLRPQLSIRSICLVQGFPHLCNTAESWRLHANPVNAKSCSTSGIR